MEKTYVIIWKADATGRTGRGTKLMEQREAETLARELNRDYPEFQHLVLNTAGDQPAYLAEAFAAATNDSPSILTLAGPATSTQPPLAPEPAATPGIDTAHKPVEPSVSPAQPTPAPSLPEEKAA